MLPVERSGRTLKWRRAAEQLEQGCAERVDVRGKDRGAVPDLGRGVEQAKGLLIEGGYRGSASDLGDAEVGELDVASPVHHDVCRLDVTVDDALLVQGCECV